MHFSILLVFASLPSLVTEALIARNFLNNYKTVVV